MMKNSTVPSNATEATAPSRIPSRHKCEPIVLDAGEYLVFSPEGLNSRTRPVCAISRFANGEIAIHFRTANKKGHRRFGLSSAGCTFKLSEFDQIAKRINELASTDLEFARARRNGR